MSLNKQVKTKEQKPLPKWFDGTIYNEGSEVKIDLVMDLYG